jgi:pyridoxal biosynthesis lyase PdxS
MDVINPEQVRSFPFLFFEIQLDFLQARIAEEAGACAVMALERVPADIRADGGVARMVSLRHYLQFRSDLTSPSHRATHT